MPEWYLAVAILMALSTVSLIWSPLKLLLPLLLGFVLPPLAQASLSAARASFNDAPLHGAARLKRRLLTAALDTRRKQFGAESLEAAQTLYALAELETDLTNAAV